MNNKLKVLRPKRDWTQADLAEKMDALRKILFSDFLTSNSFPNLISYGAFIFCSKCVFYISFSLACTTYDSRVYR